MKKSAMPKKRTGKENYVNIIHIVIFVGINYFTLNLVSIFSVVRFPNDVCTGLTRSGICYTSKFPFVEQD